MSVLKGPWIVLLTTWRHRPSDAQPHSVADVGPYVSAPLTPPNSVSRDTKEDTVADVRRSFCSGSQISDVLVEEWGSHSPVEARTGVSGHRTHTRAYSDSTLGEHQRIFSEASGGTLKTVIDRSTKRRPKTSEYPPLPSLQVPIPHYRLGTPRFSTQGTPILRSSAYTRTSDAISDNLPSPTPEQPTMVFLAPPESGVNRTVGGRKPDLFLKPNRVVSEAASGVTRSSAALPTSNVAESTEPIEPALFDALTEKKDDPSVVRYSPKTGELAAATPARIVAQISSEAFMDYDLVSDFFLTFRAYLSTSHLLSLLLARLKWAINRWEADGRIIRIRTFAALRHWILNYFVDDFVMNRQLRVQFCRQINDMYHEVRGRTTGGVSDLKILQDLKRCWNGRCSLQWDSTGLLVDADHEADINPGDVVGSRDSDLPQRPRMDDEYSSSPPAVTADLDAVARTWLGESSAIVGHRRQASALTVDAPSEQSFQPTSCSFPAKTSMRSPSHARRTWGPHPVTILEKGRRSPSKWGRPPASYSRQSDHAHKRSGSFSDSVRDRNSTDLADQRVPLMLPHTRSLIRGNMYPPAAPYVDVIIPASPPSQLGSFDESPAQGVSAPDTFLQSNSSPHPGVKNIIGSIRRALSSKHGVTSGSAPTSENQKLHPSIRGKISALPLNVTKSSETLRSKAIAPTRTQLRIDLLCAAVAQSYRHAQANVHGQQAQSNQGIGIPHANRSVPPSSVQHLVLPTETPDLQRTQRLGSHVTARSGSIVIVDDTGLDIADTPTHVPVSAILNEGGNLLSSMTATSNTPAPLSHTLHGLQPKTYNAGPRRSGIPNIRRSASLDSGLNNSVCVNSWPSGPEDARSISNHRTTVARSSSLGKSVQRRSDNIASTRLQRYVFLQGSITKAQRGDKADATAITVSAQHDAVQEVERQPAHTLRRRPGGHLRNIQNVHDLGPTPRPESSESTATTSDSICGSLLIMTNSAAEDSYRANETVTEHPVSLIRTHSSQHLRASFEAVVKGLKTIPDDDDGGLAATLLKLEGKYEKTSPEVVLCSDESDKSDEEPISDTARALDPDQHYQDPAEEKRQNPDLVVQEGPLPAVSKPGAITNNLIPVHYHQVTDTPNRVIPSGLTEQPNSVALSDDSYSSVPLLERGLTDESMRRQELTPKSYPSIPIPRPLFSRNNTGNEEPTADASNPSIELVEETESMKQIPNGGTLPLREGSPAAGSFLLGENESLSDLSSEISVDVITHSDVVNDTVSPTLAAPGTAISGFEIPTHPLAHPPSPSFTLHRLVMTPPINPMMHQQLPLTPDTSPVQGHQITEENNSSASSLVLTPTGPAMSAAKISASAGHIPFVLACDSEILAQQFTLVEQAALSEVDWNDLVELRWNSEAFNILNWADYLAVKDTRGIDMVITRFNLVVKWALSEIVMTQDIQERAKTITKYIHIAAHARKLHNYATMLQITMALTSIDCARLKKTWELVQLPERSVLKNMELLAQPVRNFHDLRVEMETVGPQDGCIPFVGKCYPDSHRLFLMAWLF